MPLFLEIDLEVLLVGLVMPISLAIILALLALAQVRKIKNGRPNSPIICPLDPTDLHQDMRTIVEKLDTIANNLSRLMGRLEDGGRRDQSRDR